MVAAIITKAACDALGYAHALKDSNGQCLNIVHRDVSPSNIFVTFQGAVKVLDFGIAKARGRIAQTDAGHIKGKLSYMPPEQAVGMDVDARSDLFAIGIVLHEMLTGLRPPQNDDLYQSLDAIVTTHAEQRLPVRADIPPKLEAILNRALKQDRA